MAAEGGGEDHLAGTSGLIQFSSCFRVFRAFVQGGFLIVPPNFQYQNEKGYYVIWAPELEITRNQPKVGSWNKKKW